MKFDRPIAFSEYHPIGCRCDDCRPAAPSDDTSVVGTVCLLMVGGMVAAVPIAAIVDLMTTRVGLLSIFGS